MALDTLIYFCGQPANNLLNRSQNHYVHFKVAFFRFVLIL